MFKKPSLIIIVICLFSLAFGVRAYHLSQVPAGVYYDEIDTALQAKSLLQTGKDYRGHRSPFYVLSFNDPRAPLPIYLTTIPTLLFADPYWQIRGLNVILGSIIPVLVFILLRLWSKRNSLAIIAGLVFAFSPWQIQFSRFSYEGIPMLALYLISLYVFFVAINKKHFGFLVVSVFLLGLCIYTYRTMSLFVPITFLLLTLLYFKELIKLGGLKLLLPLMLIALLVTPFLYVTTVGAPDVPRISQLAIFSDKKIPIWVQRNREVDSGDFQNYAVGKHAALFSYLWHNKPLSWLDAFINNYAASFSSEFLLTKGDANLRHNPSARGQILFIEVIPLVFGLYFLIKNRSKKEYIFLLSWFLLAPIPSAITQDGATHASRLFIFSAPLLIIISLGWCTLFEIRKQRSWQQAGPYLILGIWLISFLFYLHHYFVHYPVESAHDFGFGYREVMLKVKDHEKDFDRVYMVMTYDPPMPYYLYWAQVPLAELQTYGTRFALHEDRGQRLDKYKVVDWQSEIARDTDKFEEVIPRLDPKILYLITANELEGTDLRQPAAVPPGLKVLERINYPNNEPAFYLITREASPSAKL